MQLRTHRLKALMIIPSLNNGCQAGIPFPFYTKPFTACPFPKLALATKLGEMVSSQSLVRLL
jgi:hypothetical protein